MTAFEIANGILEKLQDENRVLVETLHVAQTKIKYSERQLAEKDRLIKMLQDQLRSGTDGILEMSNRQKELTIKNLHLQVEKLLKEKEELEYQLEAVKAEVCPRCETKLLLKENCENRNSSKFYKPIKSGSGLFEKKTSQSVCPNRVKQLERIVQHKDNRIGHLSKEVQRLTQSEKELNQKVYRLTKLLPKSRLPPEVLTECLLKEIQTLESQRDDCENYDKLESIGDLCKFKKNTISGRQTTSKVNMSKSNDKFHKSSTSLKTSATSLPLSDIPNSSDMQINRAENEVLHKKLQNLYNDVNELKRLFAFESDKLSDGIKSTANEYNSFKLHLEEIINNLNDVIHNILGNSTNFSENKAEESDDKYTISCLQKRLSECLETSKEHEKENKELKEKVDQLRLQLTEKDVCSCDCKNSGDKVFKSFTDSYPMQNINDVTELKDIIRQKDAALEKVRGHMNDCQNFIRQLQETIKRTTFDGLKMPPVCSCKEKASSTNEYENNLLKIKLDAADRNIKTLENFIEQLQKTVQKLEDENIRIESELHMVKSKALSETYSSRVTHSKQGSCSGSCINTMKSYNEDLKGRIRCLEEDNSRLKTNIESCEAKNISLDVTEQEKILLKSKLDASEKHICSLQKSVETLQEKLKVVESEKNKLEIELKEIKLKSELALSYENNVMALKKELSLKEEENKELKESLYTLENKALEMSHYRKSLHGEIENLCKVLMESSTDSSDISRRRAIYKAAALHSAKALLRLDENFNLKPDDSSRSGALDEMRHQTEVYLTEVSRIHELINIKEHERDELLKEYLDVPDITSISPSSPFHYKVHTLEERGNENLQSSSDLPTSEAVKTDLTLGKNTESVKTTEKIVQFSSVDLNADFKNLQEELAATKNVTNYLLSSCTRLEDMLTFERTERAKSERELEVCQESFKDLQAQLNYKNTIAKRLNTLIESMRSKEYNDEITLEQLKSEIKYLGDENKKIYDRVSATQLELCQCKEENSRIQNDLDSLKRQLLNEKYEHAKVKNELKHLQLQIAHSQSASNESLLN